MNAVFARRRAGHDALPAGHRPGAVAARVRTDLQAVHDARDEPGAARLPNGVCVTLTERIERQFLMHTVSVTIATAACGPAACGRAQVQQTGWVRRTGIRIVAASGSDPRFCRALAALAADAALAGALRRLHLSTCTIDAHDGRWTLAIVPFGGSEVVNRMPSFRRYVRLIDEQAAALHAACAAFEGALHGILHG
ncbi:DUF3156 family protein [Burkholderia multivorans]|nr:DUF3156 family protein [Burkholderia multivorans]